MTAGSNAQEWRGGNKIPALECRLRQCRLNIMFHVDVEDSNLFLLSSISLQLLPTVFQHHDDL
eukprot:scaffold20711_cov124-Skeletonema_marinoi.AAC.2